MRRLVVTAALASAVLTACGGGLSEQDRTDFLAGCVDGGATQQQCECILDYYEDAGVENPEDVTADLTVEAATACAAAPAPAPTGT